MEQINEVNTDDEYKKLAVLTSNIRNHADWQDDFLENGIRNIVNYKIPQTGSTILHIIVEEKFSIEAFKFLIENNTDITARNKSGSTVLHKAFQLSTKYHADSYIQSILSAQVRSNNFENPTDRNGITHFHVACAANNIEAVEFFLKHGISVNEAVKRQSQFVPGCTPLHIAAKNSYFKVAKLLISHGAKVHLKDAKGLNPLHMLIEERKTIDKNNKNGSFENQLQINKGMIKLLLYKCNSDKSINDLGLTHLQVISTLHDKNLVNNFLDQSQIDLNDSVDWNSPAWPGYTALHFAAIFDLEVFKLLYKRGANIKIRDAHGLTPLELSLKHDLDYWISKFHQFEIVLMYGKPPLEIDIECGLRIQLLPQLNPHLKNMKKLLHSGTDVNIYLNLDDHSYSAMILQVTSKVTALEQILCHPQPESTLLNELKCRKKRWQEVRECIGMTNLHVACLLGNHQMIRQLLNGARVDVNAQINIDSPVWSGSTPTHLYIAGQCLKNEYDRNYTPTLNLLVCRGANVMIKDRCGNTPIHDAFELWIKSKTRSHFSYFDSLFEDTYNFYPLISGYEDFKSNPISANGLSHFHVACAINVIKMVKNFCMKGVDVNQRVDYFHHRYGGDSPLHIAIRCNSEEILEALLHAGAEIEAKNLFDETPFMSIWKSTVVTPEIINVLCKYGCETNAFDPVTQQGYIGLALASMDNSLFNTLISAASTTNLDENGRNAIHNVVSIYSDPRKVRFSVDPIDSDDYDSTSAHAAMNNYNSMDRHDAPHPYDRYDPSDPYDGYDPSDPYDGYDSAEPYDRWGSYNSLDEDDLRDANTPSMYNGVISKLINSGLDVNLLDIKGMTPLHYAVKFRNTAAIDELLRNGADINNIDIETESTVASSCLFHERFMNHIRKLKFSGLYIRFEDCWFRDERDGKLSFNKYKKYSEEIERMKQFQIGSTSIFLHQFLTDMGATAGYIKMPSLVRSEIDNYFLHNIALLQSEFNCFSEVLLRQYRKALARGNLLLEAINSLHIHTSSCLPMECCEIIMEFLTNDELKNLITSTSL